MKKKINTFIDKEKIILNEIIEFKNVDDLISNINFLEFAKNNVLIIVKSYLYGDKITFNEYYYYKKLNIIINNLSKYKQQYNLQFDVINREIFNKAFKINDIPNNVNVYLKVDFYPEINIRSIDWTNAYLYTIDEYIKEEKVLNDIIKPLTNKNVSPLEKYLYIYNVVKNYKPYKESDDTPYESRTLKHILKNDYMVCVGYSVLLKVLLDKVNIRCKDLDVNYSLYNKDKIEFAGHQRNLVKIDDEKYNIHGIYVSDPTFDHDLNNDLYINSLVMINQRILLDKKILNSDTHNNDFNLLFNFKNVKELKEKINIDSLSNYWNIDKNTCYERVFNTIMELLQDLDTNIYKKFYNKYYKDINKCLLYENVIKYASIITKSNKNIETVFNNFLNDYSNYIILNTTKTASLNLILEAAYTVKKEISNYSEKQLNEWKEITYKQNKSLFH